MTPVVVVDTGPLVAAYNSGDRYHTSCAALLRRRDLQFAIPALCIGEAGFVIGSRAGWRAEAAFVRAVSLFDLRLPLANDWGAISDLIDRYHEFDIGVVDASVIVLAETLGATTIATLDHRHFRAVRPRHVEAFTLVPEL